MMHSRFFHCWSNDLIVGYNVNQPTKWLVERELSARRIIFGVVDKIIRLEESLSNMLASLINSVIRIALHKALHLILYRRLTMAWSTEILLKYPMLTSTFLTNNTDKSKSASIRASKQADLCRMPYGIN